MTAPFHRVMRGPHTRETWHRRLVVLGAALLVASSMSPVLAHHVPSLIEPLVGTRAHILSLCTIALHAVATPVHGAFHVLLAAGALYAVVDRARAIVRLHATTGALARAGVSPSDAIIRAARRAGVKLETLCVIPSAPVPAFTAGLMRPRIYLSSLAATVLAESELAAVLAHENAHRLRRDPLRLSAWRFLACFLFFLPVVQRLGEDMADELEIEADDWAVAHAGVEPLALASALVGLAALDPGGGTLPTTAVGFIRDELLERRVRRLAGEASPLRTHLTRRSSAATVVGLLAVWVSGLVVAQPIAAASVGGDMPHGMNHGAPVHCQHHDGSPLSHLFCLFAARPVAASGDAIDTLHCPHS